MLDVADYELVWPPELFAAEARRLLDRPRLAHQAIDLLLREAFRDESAAEDLNLLADFDPWGSGPPPLAPRDVLAELAGSAHRIRRSSLPRPYWPQRQGRGGARPYQDPPRGPQSFPDPAGNLDRHG